MASTYPAAARVAFLVVKLVAIVVGLVGSLVAVMSMVGVVIENGWLRGLVAGLVVLVPPLLVADRLLPDDTKRAAPGLVSDVFALFWLIIPIGWSVGAHEMSRPLLAREGDRLAAADHDQLASAAYWMASVDVKPLGSLPAGSASASGSAAPSGSAPAWPAGSVSASAVPLSASAPEPAVSAPPPRPPVSGDKTPAELFKLLSPSVVTIHVKGEGREESGGTGFLLDDHGTIATNHHVIAGGKAVQVKFSNGAVFEKVDLLVDNETADLALLDIDLEHPADAGPRVDARPLTLGDSETVVVGERAISIGNPLGLDHTLTDGLVSARRLYEGKAWIQMSVPVSPGNSGGPLFNMRGEVIGITTMQVAGGMFGRAQNLNLAVPVNELKKQIATSYPGRRPFGEGGGRGGHW